MSKKNRGSSYYERNRERILEAAKQRYDADPEFREATQRRARNRYHEDEEYRKATIERAKARYRRQKETSHEGGPRNPEP